MYLLTLYKKMLRIRKFEEEIASRWSEQEMRSPPHFYSGQEAVAAGVTTALKSKDTAVGYYRGHGYFLAMGGDSKAFMAEMYCKKAGSNRGKGGSMLLSYPKAGYVGSSAIVAGGIPIATGMAFGYKIKKENKVSVCFLGDASTEEGVFYESLSFAALYKLPILYICENNFYAVTTHISFRQPRPKHIIDKAKAFGINCKKVDGNDVVKVYKTSKMALSKIRKGDSPFFIEAITYRLYEHVGEKFDSKTGLRTQKEFDYWTRKDPIKRLEQKLIKEKILNKNKISLIDKEIENEIKKAFKFGQNSPLPNKEDLLKDVYA